MGRRTRRSPLATLTLLASIGCASEASPRPQLVIVLDTTAPVVDQAALDRRFSGDAAIDTVRVEALDGSVEPREFVVPNPLDWPLSFGVVAPRERPVGLWVRAFRASHARPLGEAEPIPEATIERVLEVRTPASGVQVVAATLDGGCLGRRSRFAEPLRTCGSEGEINVAPTWGLSELPEVPSSTSRLGQWKGALQAECAARPASGRICIRGGFTLLGDPLLVDVQIGVLDSAPVQPAVVSPFWVDASEFSVRRFRSIAHLVTAPLPSTVRNDPSCTFPGLGVDGNDDLPLNCLEWETARQLCEISGGRLPSEAEWEHMARGRGDRTRFPWGNANPECCTARFFQPSCPILRLAPVDPRPDAACSTHDVSRDGVFNLAGNLSEYTNDSAISFRGPECWMDRGVLRNPSCQSNTVSAHTARGGNWDSGVFFLNGAVRIGAAPVPATIGFRCVYEDRP